MFNEELLKKDPVKPKIITKPQGHGGKNKIKPIGPIYHVFYNPKTDTSYAASAPNPLSFPSKQLLPPGGKSISPFANPAQDEEENSTEVYYTEFNHEDPSTYKKSEFCDYVNYYSKLFN